MPKIFKIICTVVLVTLFLGETHAQKRSVGTSFSYAGTGLVYEHVIDGNSFTEIQLRMETSTLFSNALRNAGVSASFSWNMVFADIQARDGNRIDFFAGPGAMIGLAEDIKSRTGLVFGLKGRIGGECTFNRNVRVSLCLSPVIGVHLGVRDGMLNMLLYKNGLLYGIMPEIGIKYAF